jgi:hypothetical protein
MERAYRIQTYTIIDFGASGRGEWQASQVAPVLARL